ncbi:hypothetical protein NDU88_006714 [Pleurodeles waltl]|uniref:Uncharacterized protein n=1 Tax=Pleurodeles waltl TaxID=8319 RepID=A0AAV7VQE8_PLEWA|nr:hypothetical protein NDU88_006714 [Pleurodeles waltl]
MLVQTDSEDEVSDNEECVVATIEDVLESTVPIVDKYSAGRLPPVWGQTRRNVPLVRQQGLRNGGTAGACGRWILRPEPCVERLPRVAWTGFPRITPETSLPTVAGAPGPLVAVVGPIPATGGVPQATLSGPAAPQLVGLWAGTEEGDERGIGKELPLRPGQLLSWFGPRRAPLLRAPAPGPPLVGRRLRRGLGQRASSRAAAGLPA